MSTFLIIILVIHAVIGLFVGLFMFGVSNAGKAAEGWRLIAGFFMYMGIGQIWLPVILYINLS